MKILSRRYERGKRKLFGLLAAGLLFLPPPGTAEENTPRSPARPFLANALGLHFAV